VHERIAANVRKSWLLVGGFVAFVAVIGWLSGTYFGYGMWGLVAALGIAAAMTAGSYFSSDRVALSMSRARPADPVQFRQLHNIVEGLSIAAGIPKPRVYVVDDRAPNAFATGRDPEHAAVAVTTGLLEVMNRDELEGVMAHELSHIQNRDTLVMTIAVTLVGVVVLLADWLLRAMWWGAGSSRNDRGGGLGAPIALVGLGLMILAPFVARALQFAISRRREFLADADAVNFTRYPDGLVSALEKLRAGDRGSLRKPRHGSSVDRGAHRAARAGRASGKTSIHARGVAQSPVRHPPPVGGADRSLALDDAQRPEWAQPPINAASVNGRSNPRRRRRPRPRPGGWSVPTTCGP
jgi:heat shock protein HtpX